MICILAIQCRSVGNLPDSKMEFTNGMNLVIGKNESGKSTFIRAIADTLFGAENDSLRPIGFTGDYGAAIRLSTSEGEYVFDRNFATNEVQIFCIKNDKPIKQFEAKVSPKGRSSDVTVYLKKLEEILGIGDRHIFEASVLLNQQELGLGKKETVRKIKQILAGQATHDYDAVIEGLWEQYFRITNVNPDGRNKIKPRRLQEELSKLDSYERQLRLAIDSTEQCNQTREQIDQLEKFTEKLKGEIKNTDTLIKLAADYMQLDETVRDANQKLNDYYEEHKHLTELKTKINMLDNEVAKLGIAAHVDENEVGQLRNRVTLLSRIESQTVTTQKAKKALDEILAESRLGMTASWTIAAVTMAAGAVSAFYGNFGYPAFFVVALGMAGIGFYLRGIRKTKISQKQSELQGAKKELDRLTETKNKLEIRSEILALGENNIPNILAEREKGIALLREKERYEAQLEVLPTMTDMEEAIRRSEKTIAKTQVEQEKSAKVNPKIKSITHDQLVSLIARLDDMQEQLLKSQGRLHEARERYATQKATAENPESLQEQIAQTNEQVEFFTQKSEALLEAIRAVQWAVKEYRGEYLKNFSAQVDALFASLVRNTDRSVFMDKDLTPSLQIGNGSLSLDRLSTGTQDMLYLSARITLADRLAKQHCLPMILDDPLVNFDKERKRRSLEKLSEVSKNRQILLFTHDESQSPFLEGQANVIRL